MKKVFLFALCISWLLNSSCKNEAREINITTFETIGGIEYVHNPETPLYPDRKVSFKEELSIEEEDEAGRIQLYKPDKFIVDGNENIYICDQQDCAIKVFNSDGRLIRSFGRKGQGPGEFQYFASLALLPNGNLLVQDAKQARTSIFSLDGRFLSSHIILSSGKYSVSYYIYFTTDSSYTRNESVAGKQMKRFVKTYDLSGRELLSFGEFKEPQFQKYQVAGQWIGHEELFVARSVVAGDQTNKILYHSLGDKFLIEIYNQDGRLFRKIDRPYKNLPVLDEDIRRFIEGMAIKGNISWRMVADKIEAPKFKPVMQRMIVDDIGNLWIQTYEEREREGKTFSGYDIFNNQGVYEARIWSDLPPQIFQKGKMYLMKEDPETGSRSLKRYEVIWND